ncbi:ABC transporter ATP-binding protein [Luteimonas sp. e5]
MSSDQLQPVVSVRSLSKGYAVTPKPFQHMLSLLFGRRRTEASFFALDNVSFEVRSGETVGIIGQNGAGKSTLLQLISGVLEPSSGTAEVNGRVAALLELGAGFNVEFTGRENARFNARLLGVPESEFEDRLEQIYEFSELGDFLDRPVKTYSSGMYVRLAFSVAIHVDPALLIVDEALSVGDARFQAKCMDRIEQIKNAGATILFVSHDVFAVRKLCDRAIWLDGGKVRMVGDVVPVTSAYTRFLFETNDEEAGPDDVSLKQAAEDEPRESGWDGVPLAHWGAATGTIMGVEMYASGRKARVFNNSEKAHIRICWHVGPDFGFENPSVAFSIKDTNGIDLIVASTWDMGVRWDVDALRGTTICVDFRLEMALAPGDYLLVVAVEDHSASRIDYVEYIEGACYFSCNHERRIHGMFVPQISCAFTTQEGRS